MRIEQLEYFEAVAKKRSLNLASEQLHLTPQALSVAIKTLEKELGVILINRSYNGITLTKEGQEIAELAQEILERVEKMRNVQATAQADDAKVLRGSLRIHTTSIVSSLFVAPTISTFFKRYPYVSTSVEERHLSKLLDDLPTAHFDLAVLHIPQNQLAMLPQQYLEDFIIENIFASKVVIACNKKHPLAEKRMVSWKMIREYPLLMVHEDNLNDFALSESIKRYGGPTAVAIFSNVNLCIEGLKDSQSMALTLPNTQQYLHESLKKELCFIPLRENIPISVLLIQHRHEVLSNAAQLYSDMLRDFILQKHIGLD